MRSDRWQVLASDLKSVPPLALGRVKFRVNLIKYPIGVAFSSPPHLGLGQHFKVLWHLQNCLDGAKIVQRVREWWYNVSTIIGLIKFQVWIRWGGGPEKVNKTRHKWTFKRILRLMTSRKMTFLGQKRSLEGPTWTKLKLRTSSIQYRHPQINFFSLGLV